MTLDFSRELADALHDHYHVPMVDPANRLDYAARTRARLPVRQFFSSRRWLSGSALTSALLAIVVAVMWGRSLSLIDNWAWGTQAAQYQVFSHGGGIYVTRIVGWADPHSLVYRPEGPKGWDAWGDESCYVLWKARPNRFAFVRGSLRDDGLQPCWLVVVPYWSIVGLTGVLPLWWVLCLVRHRKSCPVQGLRQQSDD